MESDDFGKQLSLMRAKALKYDNMSARYIEIAKKLKTVSDELGVISKEIDPFLAVQKPEAGHRAKRGQFMDIEKELYEKCMAGTEISRRLVEAAYPGFSVQQYGRILQQLKGKPNIEVRKEGMNIFLYAKRDNFRETFSKDKVRK